LLVEIEDVPLLLLTVRSSSRNAPWLVHKIHLPIHPWHIVSNFLAISISHEGIIVGVELQLFGELLLSHVKPLMMHAALVTCCSQVSG